MNLPTFWENRFSVQLANFFLIKNQFFILFPAKFCTEFLTKHNLFA